MSKWCSRGLDLSSCLLQDPLSFWTVCLQMMLLKPHTDEALNNDSSVCFLHSDFRERRLPPSYPSTSRHAPGCHSLHIFSALGCLLSLFNSAIRPGHRLIHTCLDFSSWSPCSAWTRTLAQWLVSMDCIPTILSHQYSVLHPCPLLSGFHPASWNRGWRGKVARNGKQGSELKHWKLGPDVHIKNLRAHLYWMYVCALAHITIFQTCEFVCLLMAGMTWTHSFIPTLMSISVLAYMLIKQELNI